MFSHDKLGDILVVNFLGEYYQLLEDILLVTGRYVINH